GASEELYRSTGQVECRSDRTQCGLGRPPGVGGLDHTDHEQAVEVSAHCCFRSARAYIDLEPHRVSLPGGSLSVRVTHGRRDHNDGAQLSDVDGMADVLWGQFGRFMSTALKAVTYVSPGFDQTCAGNVQVDGERLFVWIGLLIPVRVPVRRRRSICDLPSPSG